MSGRVEIRDPLHVFIRLADSERRIIDSEPFQRMRHIHQLALTSEVYPGATHRRFEHSLGVMELASRIFDVVCDPVNLEGQSYGVVPDDPDEKGYWRRALRAAALFHDVGHLPFSHAAENLLPEGFANHEQFSFNHILSDEMREVWMSTTPPLRAEDVAVLAVEPEDVWAAAALLTEHPRRAWIDILRDIITHNAFGADRMDYLLRDSLHAGVAYGRFDHFRLIDTLRILPPGFQGAGDEDAGEPSQEPNLGITKGGLQAAEALLLARYSMFTQVYFHRVRRVYDLHLADFLRQWLPDHRFSPRLDDHLAMTDNEVLTAVSAACRYRGRSAPKQELREFALRLCDRSKSFKLLYERTAEDVRLNADAAEIIASAAAEAFGGENVRYDPGGKDSGRVVFPVRERNGNIESSTGLSEVLRNVPASRYEYVFIHPDKRLEAEAWLAENKQALLEQALESPEAEDA
jgi:HD superfamily phosphohydrolase